MKRASTGSLPDPALSQRLIWSLIALVALPLVLFAWITYLRFPLRLEQLAPVAQIEVWHEDLGHPVFDQDTLSVLTRTPPDWTLMHWQPATLPYVQALGTSINLPPDAPKRRVWVRIPVPVDTEHQGRLGLLGMRVQGGGPWALWVDGRLQQVNLADWRIQWNVPLRLTIPLGAREVMLAVPYAEPQGFSVGSLLMGPMDVVDAAWLERNLLHLELPRFMAMIAFLLAVISFQLAWARPREPIFRLLGANALVWTASSIQFAFDATGQDGLAVWLSSVVDSSITWSVILGVLFALEYENVQVPRLKILLVVYAAVSTLLTLPLWDWQRNALMAQQYINLAVFIAGVGTFIWHVLRHPRREGWALLIALLIQAALGLHTLQNLTNQTNPDSFYSFPLGTLVLYLTFTYVMGRRTVAALEASEQHEQVLRQQLDEQERHLERQHALLQKLEVDRRLNTQHESIMQDLHDRLGSNLTSALLQARSGELSSQETVLLLQDLTDELRHIARSTQRDERHLNQILAELRQRVQHRLRHGGIELEWDVDPQLPPLASSEAGQHVRAMLSEAIANVVKHAGATRIALSARVTDGQIVIEVADNGRGFDPQRVEPGRGLKGLEQRALRIGASLGIESVAGEGSRVRIVVPAGT